jgi:hypothetical protein
MHVDLPTRSEIADLLDTVGGPCVSIYLPTRPDTDDGEAERIGWKNLCSEALEALRTGGHDKRVVSEFEEALGHVGEDDGFWRWQANTLAVFTDGDHVRTYRLPNRLESVAKVADRFYVKPLLRAVTFPQAALVLALAEGSVRLFEVGPDFGPEPVDVPGLPADVASFVGAAEIGERARVNRLQGAEGKKVLIQKYARAVDRVLRGALRGADLPLILVATEPVAGIFRGVSTSPLLVEEGVDTSPERMAPHELGAAAREVLDQVHARQLAALLARFEEWSSQGRVATDLADIARAATIGSVDTLVVDIDGMVRGQLDDAGGLTYVDGDDGYDVVDEMCRRVLGSGGRVVAVRSEDVPGGGPAAALLRWV